MIVAGFGFRKGASTESLRDALQQASKKAGHSDATLAGIGVPADKETTPAFVDLVGSMEAPVIAIEPDALSSVQTNTQSARVLEMRGTGSVAEACALLAAGKGASLLTARVISSDRMATCALAKGDSA